MRAPCCGAYRARGIEFGYAGLEMSSMVRLSCLAVVSLFAAASCFAQSAPLPNEKPAVFDGKMNPKPDKSRLRNLSGLVRGSDGELLSGAIVQLKNLKTGRTIDFITRQDGSYRFDELDMDIDYELTARSDGHGQPLTKKLSKYDSRKPAILNFQLQPKDAKKSD
jgi:hypothetical protein